MVKAKVTSATKPAAVNKTDNIAEIKDTHTSQLVIALCGPIGSPIPDVAQAFKQCLEKNFGYDYAEILKLSRQIEKLSGPAPSGNAYERVKYLIDKGDELRGRHGAGVLAELAVSEIAFDRQKHKKNNEPQRFEPRRVCHIVDSIKNQQELDLLRLVYRDMVYVVGVYAPESLRTTSLQQKGMSLKQIYTLIDRDSGEEFAHGQTVRDTFPNADFFLRVDSSSGSQVNARVERFLDLILGVKVMTPTYSETAMYAAASAAGNSACLSRQVGAAITDVHGNIIATGWNDVPKFGGGLYAADPNGDQKSDHDLRCWNKGAKCYNDDEKHLIAELLVDELADAKAITKSAKEKAKNAILANGKLRNLIEFSRSVHAEMHAIINAGKNGAALAGSKLFVTTYPCHSCARHIVAAGISEVYFIEPYRKSLATKLHDDSITEDESDTKKVRVLPYDGVAPARYLKLFRVPRDSRKSKGALLTIDPRHSQPRFDKTLEALPTLEAVVVKKLREKNLIHAG
ncbi:anti-phage dCTP deaminase [Bradyrhizobium sp. B117]|uniref:anti-phage dCTP deaminase n=1 Tax=Bradyrhizobium sp. B117 TaxID=3140246 RepID=UPI0031836E70